MLFVLMENEHEGLSLRELAIKRLTGIVDAGDGRPRRSSETFGRAYDP